MQVEVVRHHGGSDDADGDVQGLAIELRRYQPAEHIQRGGIHDEHLAQEGHADERHERDDQHLQHPHAAVHEEEDEQGIQGADKHAPKHRDPEEEMQADGHADHFGQVARRDGHFGQDVQRDVHDRRIGMPAGLREIQPADDA